MKKRIVSLCVISTVVSSVNAATQAIVWGESTKALPQFMQAHSLKKQGLLQTVKGKQSDYKLELQNNSNDSTRHARYQITYKRLPVWGYQVIFHSKDGAKE
ncbi:TPA: M4 family peptidase, partial [Legionella pneumophila]|nr:M4 family peptidase [Legionella pneumophila]